MENVRRATDIGERFALRTMVSIRTAAADRCHGSLRPRIV